jgi:hypothetical protein
MHRRRIDLFIEYRSLSGTLSQPTLISWLLTLGWL